VLMQGGAARFWLTRRVVMDGSGVVFGHANRPLRREFLAETPARDLWERMLLAIGFTDGTACIDYRLVDGVPQLFEINPRFGASLANRVAPYLDAYAACVGAV